MRYSFLILFLLVGCDPSPSSSAIAAAKPLIQPAPAAAPRSTSNPTTALAPASTSAPALPFFLQEKGTIKHEVTVSASWKASLGGLVNLAHPNAKKANLKEFSVPIVLPAHVLIHPTLGMYLVDSAITKKSGYGNITVLDPLLDILARHKENFVGVLLTHSHYDHVMGIPEMPKGSAVYAGPAEMSSLSNKNVKLVLLNFKDSKKIGDIPALDLAGDGSLWALWVQGHTRGSLAFLANTTDGPMLFTGDTSHTIWGWENGVGNGGYSANKVKNQESVDKLEALVKEYPQIKVYVGHEVDGVGTGVDEYQKQGTGNGERGTGQR